MALAVKVSAYKMGKHSQPALCPRAAMYNQKEKQKKVKKNDTDNTEEQIF